MAVVFYHRNIPLCILSHFPLIFITVFLISSLEIFTNSMPTTRAARKSSKNGRIGVSMNFSEAVKCVQIDVTSGKKNNKILTIEFFNTAYILSSAEPLQARLIATAVFRVKLLLPRKILPRSLPQNLSSSS
jgi:hypothetical protein